MNLPRAKGLVSLTRFQVRYAHFQIPSSYALDTFQKRLPLKDSISIWFNWFRPNRLQELQDELTEFMLPLEHNQGIKKLNLRIKIDDEGNYINELLLEVKNNSGKPTKDVVFLHGYGASLGCFARNYSIINKFIDSNYNYRIHFLDNISFGLSSNPPIKTRKLGMKVLQCPQVKMHDTQPTSKDNVFNKYYKLIDSYEIDVEEFDKYRQTFAPILKDIEAYYLLALEGWRQRSGIGKIDHLVGHSYGSYWSSCYALKYPENVANLMLLSPVGLERHVHAITNPIDKLEPQPIKPSIDPTTYNFLSRLPLLPQKNIRMWYNFLPYLPRLLPWLGPWGTSYYYNVRYPRLFKVNKIIEKLGGPSKAFHHENDFVIGSNKECNLIYEYLYNSISTSSNSDVYIKYLLTPCTVSKIPLYDKFVEIYSQQKSQHKSQTANRPPVHLIYGQYDFMNSMAGQKLTETLNSMTSAANFNFYKISEGGHNLYLDNPFETNSLLAKLIKQNDT